MITKCAYCGVVYNDNGIKDGKVSHGACSKCLEIELAKIDRKVELDKKLRETFLAIRPDKGE